MAIQLSCSSLLGKIAYCLLQGSGKESRLGNASCA